MTPAAWLLMGSTVGTWLILLCACALACGAAFVAVRASRQLRHLEEQEDRSFDRLLGNLGQTTQAIRSTTRLVHTHFGPVPEVRSCFHHSPSTPAASPPRTN